MRNSAISNVGASCRGSKETKGITMNVLELCSTRKSIEVISTILNEVNGYLYLIKYLYSFRKYVNVISIYVSRWKFCCRLKY